MDAKCLDLIVERDVLCAFFCYACYLVIHTTHKKELWKERKISQ